MTANGTTSPSRTALLTEVVDARAGVVHARGVLTGPGADLLRGTVETLARSGHHRVTLDLTGLHDADDEGLTQLAELCDGRAAKGPALVVRRPAWGLR